jgi:amino acid transporter
MATDPRSRQREAYGGINWGAAFFGWLVAVAIGALLTGLLAAAGVAIGLGEVDVDVDPEADEIGLGGAIGLAVIALVAYFGGGYVAGRMSRFDGIQQGLGVWIWAVVVAIVLAILGWIADQEYNVLERLDLPRIPADETVTGWGIAALIVIVLGSLLAAMAGGKVGVGYHVRVDEEAAVPPARDDERAPRDRPEDERAPRDRPEDSRTDEEGRRPPPP